MRHCRSQHLRWGGASWTREAARRGLGIGPASPRKRSGDAGGGWWVARLHHSPTRGGMPKLLGAGGLHPPCDRGIYTALQMLDKPSERASFAPRFEGGGRFPRARGAFRKFGQHKGIGITRWAFRELDYTAARVVPRAPGATEVLFTMFDRGYSSGLHPGRCIGHPGRCRRASLFWPFRPDGIASNFTTSSFASDDGLRSCFKSIFAPKNVVIRKCCCCKEMTTMTTFWGVCSSCSHDWDTKVSASVPGLRERVWFDELGVRAAAA